MRFPMMVLAFGLIVAPVLATPAPDSCMSSPAKPPAGPASRVSDIVETAIGAGSFQTLVSAVKAAGLLETLQSEGPFTVFAPTDDAFARIPKEKLQELLEPENRPLLTSILTYHVVPGRVTAEQVAGLETAATANGQRIEISVDGGTVRVDDARVVETDIACRNGVIHVIDRVILPATADLIETATSTGKFGTLVKAVEAAGLVEALKGKGPFTVLAPTDAAFAALPAGTLSKLLEKENREQLVAILKYHVIPGRVYADQVASSQALETLQGSRLSIRKSEDSVSIQGAKVLKTDIESSNGVIHVIDKVILPPAGS